ncbi:hypothetical protein HZC08_01125, partial [Candidatus Micrarchaeota archaeon]|nr:hypothetical protein [Candidatus Micrarchaeota archaeon]
MDRYKEKKEEEPPTFMLPKGSILKEPDFLQMVPKEHRKLCSEIFREGEKKKLSPEGISQLQSLVYHAATGKYTEGSINGSKEAWSRQVVWNGLKMTMDVITDKNFRQEALGILEKAVEAHGLETGHFIKDIIVKHKFSSEGIKMMDWIVGLSEEERGYTRVVEVMYRLERLIDKTGFITSEMYEEVRKSTKDGADGLIGSFELIEAATQNPNFAKSMIKKGFYRNIFALRELITEKIGVDKTKTQYLSVEILKNADIQNPAIFRSVEGYAKVIERVAGMDFGKEIDEKKREELVFNLRSLMAQTLDRPGVAEFIVNQYERNRAGGNKARFDELDKFIGSAVSIFYYGKGSATLEYEFFSFVKEKWGRADELNACFYAIREQPRNVTGRFDEARELTKELGIKNADIVTILNFAYGLEVIGREKVLELNYNLGIEYFARYDKEMLLEIGANLDTKRKAGMPLMVVYFNKNDWNGAF